MKSEVLGTSGKHLENVACDEIDIDSCLRNVSVQTGEEFSPQFLQNLTHRRKMQASGESSQEYQQEHITYGRSISKGENLPTKIVQTVKEYHEIPTGNVMGQCQQKRVEFQCNQNEKLIYEYQTGSKISKNDPVNGTELSDFWGCRGLEIEAEQTAYTDSTTNYRHNDYNVNRYHQNPQQTSTYTNEMYNVQAGFHAYKHTYGSFSEKMKFLCSFGGRILTRPSDGKLRYVGGETRIISVNKNLSYEELMKKTYAICNQPHTIKYQLPGEDLDALISVCSDEDFHHMVDEYQELEKDCQRLRVFLEYLIEHESPCSSEASSIDLADNAYKYVVAVNGFPEAVLQRSSTRESSGSLKDSTTSLQRDPQSSINPTLTTELPNPAQFIQSTTNMKTPCMQSPSFHMPVQYKETINTQLEVGKDQVNHLDVTGYHVSHTLDNIATEAYNPTFEDKKNVNFMKPLVNESTIQSENIMISRKQSINVVSDMPYQLEESISLLQQQDMIKWMEKNNLNFGFDLDAEEFQNIVSPATPLERQPSIATTVSSDAVSNLSSGLHHNTSLEANRADINGENPFLLTDNDHILTSNFNENNHLISDLLIPNSTICAPISSDVSLGESSIDNLGSQTSDEKNADDMPKYLPPDIHLSITDFLPIQEKTSANECVAQSDIKDVEDVMRMRDVPISDATMAEIQAGIHGLQTIKNDDLEELRELGRGTFGTVYHGKWRGTDVAIKRIKESCFSGKPTEQHRLTKDFWREAQILSQLHHPNVVALYGVVRDEPGGTLSTVTEYMANGSLRHVLSKNNRALDQRKKLIITQDAAIGVEYLHLKNIVHFDLKCDNLLVNLGDPDRPVCKVGDFGLSRIKRNSLVSGGARGTLPWIAPELLDGRSSRVSEKVDVFSFGIVMWEILTGEEPYADMHCGAIIGGIVTNTLRPPIPRHCDHDWKVLMEECWSNDPADRPSFTEITNKLQVMSVALQSKIQKRVVRHGYNHNHLYKPRVS